MGHTGNIVRARIQTQAETKLFITTLYCLPRKGLSISFRFDSCLHSLGKDRVSLSPLRVPGWV